MVSSEEKGDIIGNIIVTVIVGIGGYLVSYFQEKWRTRKDAQTEKVIDILEKRLKDLLIPLWIRLEDFCAYGEGFDTSSLIVWTNNFLQILRDNIYLSDDQQIILYYCSLVREYTEWKKVKGDFPFKIFFEFYIYIYDKCSVSKQQFNSLIGQKSETVIRRICGNTLTQRSSLSRNISLDRIEIE